MSAIQKHLQGFEHFEVAIDGINVLALVEYHPADIFDEQPVPESAGCQYVILNGVDITDLVKDSVLREIEVRYLEDRNEVKASFKLDRQIEARGYAA